MKQNNRDPIFSDFFERWGFVVLDGLSIGLEIERNVSDRITINFFHMN